jgi:hypothetical protein
MGQFKPMVKMETTEPSVMLKLKKGGHVSSKESKGEHGHSSMKRMAMGGPMPPMPPQMAGNPMARVMGAKRPMIGAGMAPRKPMMPPPAPMAAPAPQPQMNTPTMKKGGKVDDKSQDKAMIMKAFKEHDAQEHKGGKGTKLKLATGGVANGMKTGGKVSGAAIDAVMDKTTVKGTEGKFSKTKMERKATNPGYERYAAGGTVEGNESAFAKTKMERKATTPGYEKYATGGVVNGMATGGLTNPMKKGGKVDFANRPANTSKADPGYERYATGGLTHPMKKGGAAKKHFATGGSVSTGRAVAMPRKASAQPVSITKLSGTFKKGGSVCF